MKFRFFIILLSLIFAVNSEAQKLKLGELFSEGVVLQRNSKVSVWGTSTPSAPISITIQGKKYRTITENDGKWSLTLSSLKVGGPYIMSVICQQDTITLNEVYVGEVWIAAGQSNMAWTLEKTDGAKKHIANATNKNIRFVLVPIITYEGDRTRGDMNWRTATTGNVASISGVAYFFAKQLQEKLNVPVGIICCYKGGTAAEVWMSRESLLKDSNHAPIVKAYENYVNNLGKKKYDQLYNMYEKKLSQYFDSVKTGYKQSIRPEEPMGYRHYKRPYGLYNTMLKRIIPFTAKGVIWYQGEANAPRAEQYRTLFPALINEWRNDFKNPNLPFLFVQLANYDHPTYGAKPMWAELREAQLLTWQKVKNTSMVVTIDIGEKNTIHPTNKKPVGERLAACAFNTVYGIKVPHSGPVYKSLKIKQNKVILSFNFIYKGLIANGELKGFTICGKNRHFIPAKAVIKNNKVIVSAGKITNPVAVRYGWSNWTEGNLKNSANFPASPFRTDNFELISAGVKSQNYESSIINN